MSHIIQAEKFRRFDWLIASLSPRNSGITAKDGWYNKVAMTTLNTITFCFCFQKNGGKILGNFLGGNTKARRKVVNENTVKTTKT